MPRPRTRVQFAAGMIERSDNHVLIVTDGADGNAPRFWFFPRGPVGAQESPEAAMRRLAWEKLGVHVEVVVGQPPLVQLLEGQEAEVRYFFCGLSSGEAHSGTYADVRWLPRGQLREYEFDVPSQIVVEWLLEQ